MTGRGEGVMVRLNSELVSKLDAWIEAQPEPKPSRSEAIRRQLDPVKLFSF
jgi:metal-responsive CopG/Arc/MetJ family transcriptional regulator